MTIVAAAPPTDVQALLERIRALEQRLTEFESTTVLSEPETRVKRIEVYVDKNGVMYLTDPNAGLNILQFEGL